MFNFGKKKLNIKQYAIIAVVLSTIRKDDDNRREGGRKRGSSGWNDLQDNW